MVNVPAITKKRHSVRGMPVRIAKSTTLLPNCQQLVEVCFGTVDQYQDYQFRPDTSKNDDLGIAVPHKVMSFNQSKLVVANITGEKILLPKNRIIGAISSFDGSKFGFWAAATEEIERRIGGWFLKKGTVSDSTSKKGGKEAIEVAAADEEEMLVQSARNEDTLGLKPIVNANPERPPPERDKYTIPDWLRQRYVPTHKYPLPEGVTIPDSPTSSYQKVNINTTDDIKEEEIEALRLLVKRHAGLFNDLPGLVREPEADWLGIPVPAEKEEKLKSSPPIRLSQKGKDAVDGVFQPLADTGRMQSVGEAGSPYNLQVFVA
ncbi:hypothetical protein TWF481_002839 [Arthrobotrys musiformis]|uniref:Uncharacterized protein n=1 Tax=Arthrobotrys musiformis TaxID=47236 RepID=A0AAV9VSH2_9PEZI